MEAVLKAIMESVKPDLKIMLSALALIYIGYLFSPDDLQIIILLKPLNLWIHIVGIISSSYLICLLISKALQEFTLIRSLKSKEQYLRTLSIEEKLILRSFIIKGSKTCAFNQSNGSVQHLANLGILYRSSNVSHMGMHFDYTIQPWAWVFLNKNKELLGKDSDFVNEKKDPSNFKW